MRTTLTLDEDVAALLGQAAKKRRLPFKTIVIDALQCRPPAAIIRRNIWPLHPGPGLAPTRFKRS